MQGHKLNQVITSITTAILEIVHMFLGANDQSLLSGMQLAWASFSAFLFQNLEGEAT